MPLNSALLPDAARLGPVSLTVRRRAKLVQFYERALGLRIQSQGNGFVGLGFGGEDLLRLFEDKVGVGVSRHASLYHFCLAVERREDLGWWLRRLTDDGFELQGLVDHRMAEAIYLRDPEGNGIELNWDRPRSEWRPWSEWLALGNATLDIRGLLLAHEKAGPRETLPADTRVGHVHLYVGDLEACEDFYCGAIGLAKSVEIPGQAVFTAAGGYHHHVAFNLGAGRGVRPQPEGAYGLRTFSLILPDQAEVTNVAARLAQAGFAHELRPEGLFTRDPSGHGLWVQPAN